MFLFMIVLYVSNFNEMQGAGTGTGVCVLCCVICLAGLYLVIYCNWVVTRWQWLFYMHTRHEIGYY